MLVIFIVWIVFIHLEEKLESHKNVPENKFFWSVEVPCEDTKILEFNEYQKFEKTPSIIYADLESLNKRMDGCKKWRLYEKVLWILNRASWLWKEGNDTFTIEQQEREINWKDHCHYTGKYRGAADSIFNLKYSITKEISVDFRSGSKYDYYFIVKELAK